MGEVVASFSTFKLKSQGKISSRAEVYTKLIAGEHFHAPLEG